MDENKIKELPDYPALKQVQKALWETGKVHGVAVMIGAGFSPVCHTEQRKRLRWHRCGAISRNSCLMNSIPAGEARPTL